MVLDNKYRVPESTWGGDTKLSWGDSRNKLVTGAAYEHDKVQQWDDLTPNTPYFTDRTVDRWSLYANGTITLGQLTILPGIRYDETGFSDRVTSFSLGATYHLTDETLLRVYAAKGYCLPIAVWTHGLQKVWTIQAGAESNDLPKLWLKGTFFYNDTWNIEELNTISDPPVTVQRSIVKQGFETEFKTVPLFNFSLAGGYTFTDARYSDTNVRVKGIPDHLVKVSLHYACPDVGLKGVLTGNYVRWNADEYLNTQDAAFIWDLHVTQKLFPSKDISPELFFSGHNLFNGEQYLNGNYYKNAGRWLEGGVRCRF